jgi:D-aspartate ligase
VNAGLPPAILLGGENIALSAARSLSAAGARVYALGDSQDPARYSRHCHHFVDVGRRSGWLERYLEWLGDEGPREGVVLPCDDEGLELVANHRGRLEELGYAAVEANDQVVNAVLDKGRTYELCAELGVPAPRTITTRSAAEAVEAGRELGFPCALKPLQSHRFAQHYGRLTKVFLAHDPDELREAVERTQRIGVSMLVTEIIPGSEDQFHSYYTYLDESGEPLFHFTKLKLRQWPIRFGMATYHASIWDPEVAELGLRFFQGIGLRGVGNVEFKLDPRDGRWKLIECNHRFTAANDLVRAAGIDIPLLAYNRVVGRPDPPVNGYRRGLHMWHPVEDLRALRAYRREGALTLGDWLRSLRRRQHFPVLSVDDPLPSLVNNSRRVLNAARSLKRAAGGA